MLRLFVFLLLVGCSVLPSRADDIAARVVILANRNDPDSLRVADHYAAIRHVPKANVITLPMSSAETISWRDFISEIWEPLLAELVRTGWIDAIPMKLTDALGRRKYAVSGHRIAYLVVCRGVPLRIAEDSSHHDPAKLALLQPPVRINAAAVDGELSLLPQPGHAIDGYVANPLFSIEHPTELQLAQVIKVSRLDGPTPADALALVDRAVNAEQRGLVGRAYVDAGESLKNGEEWLRATARELVDLGFETDVERTSRTIEAGTRFDAPVLYFGWHVAEANGPFVLSGFEFPSGAIAVHIHSFSATTVRSTTERWCGPFVAHGVTATVGNVYEPYLELTHRPDRLLQALARGENFADAVCYAQPVFSWENIAIGDPLYRPFRLSFDEQWAKRNELSPAAKSYLVLRRMLLLERARKPEMAIMLARESLAEAPNLVVAFALAQRLRAAGSVREAAHVLAAVPLANVPTTDQWGLYHDVAEFLAASDERTAALNVYRQLLAQTALPPKLKRRWIDSAIAIAEAANDEKQAATWRSEASAARSDGGSP